MTKEDDALIARIQEVSAGYTLETCLRAHILTLSLTIACSNETIEEADLMISDVDKDLKRHVRLNWEIAKQAMYDAGRGGKA